MHDSSHVTVRSLVGRAVSDFQTERQCTTWSAILGSEKGLEFDEAANGEKGAEDEGEGLMRIDGEGGEYDIFTEENIDWIKDGPFT